MRRQTGRAFEGVEDSSIVNRIPLNHPYTGSSALAGTLAEVSLPDRPFVAVCSHSTRYNPRGRAFDLNDWAEVLATLERLDLLGVVVCGLSVRLPDHPRLIDRQGQLTLPQSVEVVKRAVGYVGIDSWPSVLAAKLFPLDRLAVKSTPHSFGRKHAAFYFAPWTEFPFLSERVTLEGSRGDSDPATPSLRGDTMRQGASFAAWVGALTMAGFAAAEEPKVLKVGETTYDEVVTVKVLYKGSGDLNGKYLTPQVVWARRIEVKGDVCQYDLYGLNGSTATRRLEFVGEGRMDKGTVVTDAKGNEYTATMGGGKSTLEVKLTKKAEAKKEEK